MTKPIKVDPEKLDLDALLGTIAPKPEPKELHGADPEIDIPVVKIQALTDAKQARVLQALDTLIALKAAYLWQLPIEKLIAIRTRLAR